ncbi:MAG: alpha/beta hydrolase [Bryobacterales bacterium]|nr:alpha/beta hydrolase [Bryobacterales bacterium]
MEATSVLGFMYSSLLLGFSILTSVAVCGQVPCTPTVVGDLRVERFESKTYGKTMTIRVWLPAGYAEPGQSDQKYPTLYILDGQTLFDECTAFKGEHELRLDETVSKLVADGKVPPLIIVGIDSTGDRRDEYALYKNPVTEASKPEPNGKRLPPFVAEEVVPLVRRLYRVTTAAAETAIGGTSLGAAAALYTSLQRPDLFGLALLESPSLLLGNGQFLRDTAFIARAPDRVSISVGATEFDFPDIDSYFAPFRLKRAEAEAGIVKMTEELAANLRAARIKRSEVMLVVAPNGRHESTSWAARMPGAITFLFGGPR